MRIFSKSFLERVREEEGTERGEEEERDEIVSLAKYLKKCHRIK